ncbi:MAG TPA: hypothetical protein V6D18_17740 [Thermosynechococcaceae cyanobacterium]
MAKKAGKRRPTIEIYCESEEQKQQINALAAERGLSTSKFLIGLTFSNGRDVGARRRTEGALVNAQLYGRIGEISDQLQDHADWQPQEKAELIALMRETQRLIALHRFAATSESA